MIANHTSVLTAFSTCIWVSCFLFLRFSRREPFGMNGTGCVMGRCLSCSWTNSVRALNERCKSKLLLLLLLLLLLHLFNSLFSRTTWVSRYQKGKPFWILLKQEMMERQWHQLDLVCKSFAPRSRQMTTPVLHHSVFTGRMPILPPNQQCQNTEGKVQVSYFYILAVSVCYGRPMK